jgi:hypothetical protein
MILRLDFIRKTSQRRRDSIGVPLGTSNHGGDSPQGLLGETCASGSYLGCLATKRTAGYGWSTRGCGNQRSPTARGAGPRERMLLAPAAQPAPHPSSKIYTATANTLQRIPYSPKISRPPILPPSHGTFGLLGGRDSEADSGSAQHCFEQSDESTYSPTSLPWVWGIFIGHVSEIGGMHRVTARRRARTALGGNRCGTYQRKTLNPSG